MRGFNKKIVSITKETLNLIEKFSNKSRTCHSLNRCVAF